ncbi:DUF6177 family protein [Streptomyces europaeiscabiei]|uniref:DUF6177 family protein n=1 Tax=Streptomyces europaeiscabiei TaxID=146819 RepID=UPI0029BC1E4D|nr:DUF6177 family protein [Streptomyces europaeiscabiei]MDX2525163.1 DUF6177 family protein [Streptomyces europaeiscabiei]
MTQDFVALTPKMPDARTLLAGLYAGGPDLRVDSVFEGAAIRLRAPDGQPLVTVEVPLFLQVPGEVSRLLGESVPAEAPVWWTEVRAITAVEEAGRLAGSVAGRMTAVLGGTSWPPEAAHTRVVSVPSENRDAAPTAGDDQPLPVDVLTDKAAVVFQDRPVVAATTWLSDLLQDAVASDREVQIVTPPSTRLTLPARALLTSLPARWIIRDPQGGYYDGLTGAVLHWHASHFTPAPTINGNLRLAEAFTPPAASQNVGEQQLILTIRTTRPASEHLLLGGTLETCWQTFTGGPPAGWSTAEPVNLPWSPRQLTELARTRAQKSAPTWLVAVGTPDHPAIATLRITHTPAGVEEHITLAVGYTADQPAPLDVLPDLAEALTTRHHLTSMLIHLRHARADLTTPPHREPPPAPLSFTLGPDAVHAVSRTIAEAAPTTRPTRLGPATRPAFHYFLGDGTDTTAWQRLKQLNDHLTTRP